MNAMTTMRLKNPPLIIDSIAIPGTKGLVGITSCPGLRDEFVFDLYGENLIDDLLIVRNWGADVVVTLLDDAELHALGVRELGAYVETFSMAWLQLPTPPTAVLNDPVSDEFRSAELQLCSRLRQGQRVVIHCKNGVARAGLVAARLLMNLGVSGEEAVRVVRKARPGSLPLTLQERQ